MSDFITEQPLKIPVKGNYDVIICGAGPAGCAAAIASSKAGCKTLLLEKNYTAGGIWTAGLMPWVIDCLGKSGFMEDWITKLTAIGGVFHNRSFTIAPEKLKLFLEEEIISNNVTLRYGTTIVNTIVDNKTIKSIITESKSGREAFNSKIVIDCTGDGDVAALSGCSYDYGNDQKEVQPSSLNAIVTGLNLEEVKDYLVPHGKLRLKEELAKCGITPSYSYPSLFPFGENVFGWMCHHAYKICSFNSDDITKAVLEGRKEIHKQIAGLKSLGGIWKDLTLVATAERLGCREGRRIHGKVKVTLADFGTIRALGKTVCTSTVLPDIHAPNPALNKGVLPQDKNLTPYLPIPFLALCAKDIDNLLLAGRCISGDFACHASYRMTGTAVPMGEAAGLAAAWAVKNNKLPHLWDEVPFLSKEN
jgi:hypothetical protein